MRREQLSAVHVLLLADLILADPCEVHVDDARDANWRSFPGGADYDYCKELITGLLDPPLSLSPFSAL